MSMTRFLIIAGLAVVMLLLSALYEKAGNRKAARLSKVGSVLALVAALIKGMAVLILGIGHMFWDV